MTIQFGKCIFGTQKIVVLHMKVGDPVFFEKAHQ